MNGILLIDKPSGWTSNDVVIKLKGMLRERRIGHSGTLDPMATGLLVVFVGRATRAVEFAEAQSKRYVASLRLGMTTDTQDVTGTVLSETECSVTESQLNGVLSRFTGEISQLPPMYSAIKVNGRRLYEAARKGTEVERKPRNITVHSINITGRDGDDFILDISCSKGTYIRTLCSDIGAALGCGGCMSALRRVSAGDFSLDRALTLDNVQQAANEGRAEELLLPVDSLFARYPETSVRGDAERKVRCGNTVRTFEPDGTYRLYGANGEFLALCDAKDGVLTTIKSFFEV